MFRYTSAAAGDSNRLLAWQASSSKAHDAQTTCLLAGSLLLGAVLSGLLGGSLLLKHGLRDGRGGGFGGHW